MAVTICPALPVGSYTLKVTAARFSTYSQSGIVSHVGNELRVDVKLQVGGVSQTVQIQAAASMVQTEDQSISQVVDRQRTVDLPLNGRQATQLILLTPGTANAPATDLASSKTYPSAVTLSVAGAQATNINYLMDGADNNDAFTNVNLPFPFPDAIQEFSVQTSGLSPQYGIHPGAVVNIVTSAGGNAFHGTLFEFFRNGCFNHTNYANPGGAINSNGTGVTNPGTALSASTFGTITAANPPRILQLTSGWTSRSNGRAITLIPSQRPGNTANILCSFTDTPG
jgi:hypothetical protein